MTNRYVWIGIAVGVFFAGIGIGYGVFVNYYNPYAMMMGNSQGSTAMMGGQGMMGSGPNLSFKTIPTKDAVAADILPSSTQVFKNNSTIVFNSQNVDLVALSLGGEEAKNMTGTSLPPYAKDDSFVIGNLIDPTLVVKSGSQLNITVINLDADMEHSLVITSTAPPYGYMPMRDMMDAGGVITMMPILPNESHDSAYEYSYSVTLSHPGTYWYACTYPGHAESGMYGKILVQ